VAPLVEGSVVKLLGFTLGLDGGVPLFAADVLALACGAVVVVGLTAFG
jgi:hypothetical protein